MRKPKKPVDLDTSAQIAHALARLYNAAERRLAPGLTPERRQRVIDRLTAIEDAAIGAKVHKMFLSIVRGF